jgi:hypothetical protein
MQKRLKSLKAVAGIRSKILSGERMIDRSGFLKQFISQSLEILIPVNRPIPLYLNKRKEVRK